MATAAREIGTVKHRRRGKPRISETVYGSRTLEGAEAEVLRLHVSRGMRERQEWEEQLRAIARRPRPQEFAAMRAAMKSVEQRIVRGLWVLELALPMDGPRKPGIHGLDYLPEEIDHYGTVASGGKWEPPPARPAVPSNREIDAAKEAKGWIEWLDDEQARLLAVAALTKRGDRASRVNWERVKDRLRLPPKTPLRTLRERYDAGLRRIVAELTIRSVVN